MSNFVLKVKTKSGHHVVSNLTATETVGKLKTQIAELTSIPVDSLSILGGFPPKPLNLTVNDENLATAGIRSGDTLIVEARQGNVISNTATPDSKRIEEVRNESNKPIEEDRLAADVIDGLNSEGILLKQVVPSDNSCLFTSIGRSCMCCTHTLILIIMNATNQNFLCLNRRFRIERTRGHRGRHVHERDHRSARIE